MELSGIKNRPLHPRSVVFISAKQSLFHTQGILISIFWIESKTRTLYRLDFADGIHLEGIAGSRKNGKQKKVADAGMP